MARYFNGAVCFETLMSSRRIFGIAEGIIAQDEAEAVARMARREADAWFDEASFNGGGVNV